MIEFHKVRVEMERHLARWFKIGTQGCRGLECLLFLVRRKRRLFRPAPVRVGCDAPTQLHYSAYNLGVKYECESDK